MISGKGERSCTFLYCKRAFFIKARKYRRFGNDIDQSVSAIFRGAFRWLFYIQSKPFVRRRLRRYRLRNKIHAIKIRQQPAAFSSTQEKYPSLFGKRLNFFVIRKAMFRTRKRFHNKQYTPKSKDQPFESERTHFDIRFNKSNVAMHRPTIIFLLPRQITTVQSKTAEINNHINQPRKQPRQSIPAFAKQKHAQNET